MTRSDAEELMQSVKSGNRSGLAWQAWIALAAGLWFIEAPNWIWAMYWGIFGFAIFYVGNLLRKYYSMFEEIFGASQKR